MIEAPAASPEPAKPLTPWNSKYKFEKAKDARGRELDGLWTRNGRYYLQGRFEDGKRRWIPLMTPEQQPVKNVTQALAARDQIRSDKAKGVVPGPRITPVLKDYYKHYLSMLEETNAKKQLTIECERGHLKAWVRSIGDLRLNQIDRPAMNQHILRRKREEKVGNRTINLDVMALHGCLTYAKNQENILKHELPTKDWTYLPHTPKKRSLVPAEDIEKVLTEALRKKEDGSPVWKQGEMLFDYLKLMQLSGARRNAAVSGQWKRDINWERKQITFHTKYSKAVVLDFHPELEAHLRTMHAKKLPDSDFMFPSPMKPTSEHARNLRDTFERVREAAGVHFTYHDMRHYFISYAVMSGIDFMTIAELVGHVDGGVLIGKVYGHLAPGHKQKAIQKLNFGVGAASPEAPQTSSDTVPAGSASLSSGAPSEASKMTVAELLALVQQKLGQQAA